MEIIKTNITIHELCEDYTNDTETNIENGVYAYRGKLCVRPAFQRSFVYDKKQENAVIDTALKGFPLNIMYWADNGNGTYDCLDGQQRTISLANFVDGKTSFNAPWLNEDPNKRFYISTIKRINPVLYEKFMNYPLEIYICKGDKAERMEWFKTINIAGEKLYPQELRNINYVGKWLADAKHYFSRANEGGSPCPAERIGSKYTNKNANRQEILEQVISWYIDSKEDADICNFMEAHMNDNDASELWNYFNSVISWIEEIFPGTYDKSMKTINWGHLYNHYKDEKFDSDELQTKFEELQDYQASKELDVSMAKIVEYCITRDENLLKARAFSNSQRTALYNRQKGICPDCGKHFVIGDMHAHHVIPWYNGGLTELNNGVMLCKECHKQRHL